MADGQPERVMSFGGVTVTGRCPLSLCNKEWLGPNECLWGSSGSLF